VAFTTVIGSIDVLKMAMSRPDEYAIALKAVHHQVAAFGGAFLLMVALEFFVNQEKDEHWLAWLEAPLKKAGEIRLIEAGITLIVILVSGRFLLHDHASQFVIAGIYGVVTYIFAKGLGSLLSEGESSNFVKQGVAGLLYLEILDASFSFDGVIGAFAVSNNLFIIAPSSNG
ncbi:DUF475 domain-containing protein, partial [bacterium]|nr:DUF475 domain-containing protein [bacterium]